VKKLWIKVVHPAPYTYVWKTSTLGFLDIHYYYDHSKSQGKIWSDYSAEQVDASNSSFSLTKKIRKSLDFDVVILSGWNHFDNLIIAFFRNFIFRKKVYFFADYPLSASNPVIETFKFILIRCISSGILSATMSGIPYFNSKPFMGKMNIHYLPYGTSLSNCYNEVGRFKEINNGNVKKIFVASNMIQRKGHLSFINALEKIPNTLLSGLEVHFAGHGECEQKVTERMSTIKVKSIFHGWLSLEDYERILNKIDILVHPSYEEPFGIPPVEAMFLGKVVVASSGVHSLDGLVKNGVNGFMYRKDDEDDLKNKIVMALSCNTAKIAKNARATALQYFGVGQIKDSLIKTFYHS
jgi:glycosyltransferase involved in cell wall biosynthesis